MEDDYRSPTRRCHCRRADLQLASAAARPVRNLACRRAARQPSGQTGGRFARKASMPSWASAVDALVAITHDVRS